MTTSADVAALLEQLAPFDDLEAEHRADALAWLASTHDVFRRVPPRTPAKHLVVYVVPTDTDGAVLLVDHKLSGLWLPAGGHVEPGEAPDRSAARETQEELGVVARFADPARRPSFVTVTETVGPPQARHLDVSLWYVLEGGRHLPLVVDDREIAGTRWWTAADVAAADPSSFDPHLGRFLAKASVGVT